MSALEDEEGRAEGPGAAVCPVLTTAAERGTPRCHRAWSFIREDACDKLSDDK